MKTYEPLSNEIIEKTYCANFMAIQENLKLHSGYKLYQKIQSLKDCLRMFNKTSDLFFDTIEQFHVEVHERNLFDRARQDDLRQYEEKFQEIIYLFSSLSKSFVEYSYKIFFDCNKKEEDREKIIIEGYKERCLLFANDSRHIFITKLRNHLHHSMMQRPTWKLTTNENHEHTSKFILNSIELKQSGDKDWGAKATQYLKENPQGIDLGILINEYREQINEYYKWLFSEIDKSNKADEINDYLSRDNFIKAIDARYNWNLLLSQVVIQKKLDPYQYLDKFLKLSEIEEIQKLPNKSKEQVDRIIEILDEYGACDENLRSLVYKSFGISD